MATSQMQLVMNQGLIDEGSANLGAHVGNVEGFRGQIKAECGRLLANFGGGAGSEEHGQVMRMVDQLIDDHVNALTTHKTGMANAAGTAAATGKTIGMRMGQTAL